METTPQSELLQRIYDVFPKFRQEWEEERAEDPFPSKTLHSVYMSFLPFVASAELADAEVETVASIINVEVAKGGNAENAVSTCMLEHLGKGPFARRLWGFLAPEARRRTSA